MKKLYSAVFAAALLAAPMANACDAMKDAHEPVTEKSSVKPSTTAAKSVKGSKASKGVKKATASAASKTSAKL